MNEFEESFVVHDGPEPFGDLLDEITDILTQNQGRAITPDIIGKVTIAILGAADNFNVCDWLNAYGPLRLESITTAASQLGVKYQRIQQLIEDGHFPSPSAFLNDRPLWTKKQIKDLVKQRAKNPPKPGRPRKIN